MNTGPWGFGTVVPVLCVALASCTGVENERRALVPNTVAAFEAANGNVAADLGAAAEQASESPTSREIERRYSEGAAKGEKPLWKKVPTVLPELTHWNATLTEIPAPYKTVDAGAAPLSFADAIQAAMVNSLEAALANEALNKAEIEAVNAIFGYLPRITATGEFTRVNQDVIDTDNAVFQAGQAEFNVLNGRVEATQPILDFGNIMAIRVAETAKSATERAYVSALQAAAFEAATTYLLALTAKSQLDSVEQRSALLGEQILKEGDLVEFGLSTPETLQLLEVQIGQNEIDRIQHQEDYDTAIVALGQLIGQPVGALADLRATPALLEAAQQSRAGDLIAIALRDNAEMQQRRLETLQQRQLLKQRFAEDFAPTVNLFANAEYEDRDDSRFGGGSVTFDHNVGVRLQVPLFNASGEGYASLEEESDLRAATLTEVQTRRALEIEVRSLDRRLKSLRGLIGKAGNAVTAADKLLGSAQRSVETGVSTDVLVLRHKVQQVNANEWLARSNYAFLRNMARMAFLTGKPFEIN